MKVRSEEETNAEQKSPREWPLEDASGNILNHAELCAWRFGGMCDCAAASSQREES